MYKNYGRERLDFAERLRTVIAAKRQIPIGSYHCSASSANMARFCEIQTRPVVFFIYKAFALVISPGSKTLYLS